MFGQVKIKTIMNLKITHFVIFTTFSFVIACSTPPKKLSKIEVKQLSISNDLEKNDAVESYINPYRQRINQIMDSTLAYTPKKITADDGEYNTSEGNLLADLLYNQANPIFKSITKKEIDFVLINHGGIRSIISKGNVTTRNAYQIMPFENTIVVAELSGKSIQELVHFILNSNTAHPISGAQIILNKDNSLASFKIQNKNFDPKKTYYVATHNYLASGGDNMVFFKDAITITPLDYKFRNAIIDYFKKVDTLHATIDNRFYKKI